MSGWHACIIGRGGFTVYRRGRWSNQFFRGVFSSFKSYFI
jgi:hypothetical protein